MAISSNLSSLSRLILFSGIAETTSVHVQRQFNELGIHEFGLKPTERITCQLTTSITCKRGSAKHSVKDDHAFLWEHAIFRYLPAETPQPIKMKFCTIDYVDEIRRYAKMVGIGWLGAAP